MATVEATRRAAAMESDVATLMDSFEGLLACAQVSDPARGEQERLQLQAHAARLVRLSLALTLVGTALPSLSHHLLPRPSPPPC